MIDEVEKCLELKFILSQVVLVVKKWRQLIKGSEYESITELKTIYGRSGKPNLDFIKGRGYNSIPVVRVFNDTKEGSFCRGRAFRILEENDTKSGGLVWGKSKREMAKFKILIL